MSVEKRLSQSELIIEYKEKVLKSEEVFNLLEEVRSDIHNVRHIVLDLRHVDDFDSTTSHLLSIFCKAFQRMSIEITIRMNSTLLSKVDLKKIPFVVVDENDKAMTTPSNQPPAFTFAVTSFFWIFRESAFESLAKYSQNQIWSQQVRRINGMEANEKVEIAGICETDFGDFKGKLILGFPKTTFLGFMTQFFGEAQTDYNPQNRDGAAELLNAIVGKARPLVSYNLGAFEIKAPAMIDPTVLRDLLAKPQMSCAFSSEHGYFWLKLITEPRKA